MVQATDLMEATSKPVVIAKRCNLCGLSDLRTLGPLAVNDTIVVHVACMVYSADVWVRCEAGHAVFMPGEGGKMLFNKHYRPHTIGFGKAASMSQMCHECKDPNATLRCSREECKKSFHLPCAIASCKESFIFHAKMVYYEKEEVTNGLIAGVIRPGRFLICKHHSEWEESQVWSFLKSYILERPNLVNGISIDVDALPHDLQIAVSKASQMLIFSPSKSQAFENNRKKDDLSITLTDVEGNDMKLPRKQWIKWDAAWGAQLKNAKLVKPPEPSASTESPSTNADGSKAGHGHITSPTAAPTPTPTPAPLPSFSESVIVPDALFTFVTKSYFTAVLKKVKEQSTATSIFLSTSDDVSAVSILIAAATQESATLARRLVGKQLEQGLAMMADRERNQKKLAPVVEEVNVKAVAESAEPLNILATVAMLQSVSTSSSSSSSSSAETKSNSGEELRVQKHVVADSPRSGGNTSYGISRKKQTVEKEEVVEIFCGTCAGLESKVMGKMLNCAMCNVYAHSKCVDGYGAFSGDGKWKCAACLDPRATQCCFCEIKSNQLIRRPTYPNCFSWIHTVCLHAQNTGMLPEKKDNSDSDSDSDDDINVCTICDDDDSKRVDLQRVKCADKDCTNCFHMSCAWLAGYKFQRVDNSQTVVPSTDLLMPINYRLHAYCEDHSGGSSALPKRERYDCAVVSDIVSKESWRENNAYRKIKPVTPAAHMPTQAAVFARNTAPTAGRPDFSRKQSVEVKSRASRGKLSDDSGDSDASGDDSESDDNFTAPSRVNKYKGRMPLSVVKNPLSAKAAIEFAKQRAAGKGSKTLSKATNKSRSASETLASTKKTMSYSAFLASAAASSGTAARPLIAAPSAPIQKRAMTSYESDSPAPTLSRLLPRKNPEKQAEFKAERLRKRQAEEDDRRYSDTAVTAPPAHHVVEDIIMKERLRRVLEYQPDCYIMIQHFGSLIEQVFTFVSQLWGRNKSLAECWKSSESLPELHWEYMLSENDFRERGFNIVINDSTADAMQVFGLDPLIRDSAGTSLLKTIVDSSFAIFCGQVPVARTKTDVIMIVHADAASGKDIGRQLTACNVHFESSYFLVAFSRNSLLTPQPAAVVAAPVMPSHVMAQSHVQPPRQMFLAPQDVTQPYARIPAVTPYNPYPFQPVETVSYYPPGFHPQVTAQNLSSISASSSYFNDNQGSSRHQRDEFERSLSYENEKGYGMHQGNMDRGFVPPPPIQPPVPTTRYEKPPEPQRPRDQVHSQKKPNKDYYGNDARPEQRSERGEIRKDNYNDNQNRSDHRVDNRKESYNTGQGRSDHRVERGEMRNDSYNKGKARPDNRTERVDSRKPDTSSYTADKHQSGNDRKRSNAHLNDSDGGWSREQSYSSHAPFNHQPVYPKQTASVPTEVCPYFKRGFCKFGSACNKGSHSFPMDQKQGASGGNKSSAPQHNAKRSKW